MPTQRQRVQVSLTDEAVQELEKVCAETGLTRSGVIQLALSEWFKERREKELAARAAKGV